MLYNSFILLIQALETLSLEDGCKLLENANEPLIECEGAMAAELEKSFHATVDSGLDDIATGSIHEDFRSAASEEIGACAVDLGPEFLEVASALPVNFFIRFLAS